MTPILHENDSTPLWRRLELPNKNYQAGVRLERKVKAKLEEEGYEAFRSAGSHSSWDVVGLQHGHPPIFVQCKRVKTKTAGLRLLKNFEDNPPHKPDHRYEQVMVVYISKTRETIWSLHV